VKIVKFSGQKAVAPYVWLSSLMVKRWTCLLIIVEHCGETECPLLLLAATERRFARLPFGAFDRKKMVLWWGCEGCARCNLHKKERAVGAVLC